MRRTAAWVVWLSVVLCLRAQGGEERAAQRDAVLREGPGAYFESVGSLRRGKTASVGESKGSWCPARVESLAGWVPVATFDRPKSSVDYLGIVDDSNGVVISSVDITAAVKGAFEARYSEQHRVQLAAADPIEALRANVDLVRRIQRDIQGGVNDGLLSRLPSTDYRNTLGLEVAAEGLLGKALVACLVTNGLYQDAKLLAYVNSVAAVVGERTERYNVQYRVAVLNDNGINGFGIPGGYVIITRGLLSMLKDEAELACVLGHEMAHISRYHGLREFKKRELHRRRDQVFSELDKAVGNTEPDSVESELGRLADEAQLKIIGGRARGDELEADVFGTAYVAAAGYDPKAALAVLQRVKELGGADGDAYRHHPKLGDRIEELNKAVLRYRMGQPGQTRGEARFREYTSGVPF
jgi:hypothetical protein